LKASIHPADARRNEIRSHLEGDAACAALRKYSQIKP
jgi:hypothetical protein